MTDRNEKAWELIFEAAQQSIAIKRQRNAAANMLEELYSDDSALLAVANLLRGEPFKFPRKLEVMAHDAVRYLHDVEGMTYEDAYADVALELHKSPEWVRDARKKCEVIESVNSKFLKRLVRP